MSPQVDHQLAGPLAPQGQHSHRPLDLTPATPLKTARRARRPVLVHQQHGSDKIQLHRVLLVPPSTLDLAAPAASSPPTIVGYTFNSCLVETPNKGVHLFLATPMMESSYHNNDQSSSSSSSSIPSSCLVSCGVDPVVVIKAIHHLHSHDDPMKEMAAMQLLQPYHHPNIMPLLDCMRDDRYIYLVMPYLSGGDLFSRVQAAANEGGGLIPEDQARSYLHQVCEGLVFMKKSHGIAHHDVSLKNMMLDNNQQQVVKIIDMGMCLRVPSHDDNNGDVVHHVSPQRCCGKPGYVAPEVVREEACDPFASDIWSLGVCLYMMLTGRPLYSSPSDKAFKIMAQPGGVRVVVDAYESYGLPPLSPHAKDLICLMLHAHPTNRPTIEEVLAHPFLLSPQQQSQS